MLHDGFEAFRVLQRMAVLYSTAIQRVARCRLGTFAVMRHRQRMDLRDALGHQRRRAAPRKLGPNSGAKGVVEHHARTQHNKQHHAAVTGLVLRPLLDRHRLHNVLDILEDTVDFRWPDTNAMNVEHPIRPTVETCSACGCEFDQVAMGPDTGILAEISGVETRTIDIAMKS